MQNALKFGEGGAEGCLGQGRTKTIPGAGWRGKGEVSRMKIQ